MVKKLFIPIGMLLLLVVLCLTANINTLLATPLITPDVFLESMPHLDLIFFGKAFVLIQPTSTLFVFFQGVLMMILATMLHYKKGNEKSKEYLAIGLFFWGLAAVLAGISYQSFGYELKARGHEYVLFTSLFELCYMLVTCFSINYIVAGVAYTSTTGKLRNWLLKFAVIDTVLYAIYLIVGSIVGNAFIISYNGFIVFVGINFVLMLVLHIIHYRKNKDRQNWNFILIWITFAVINIAFFAFMLSGLPKMLYSNFDIWFNENDILHVFLICWAFMYYQFVSKYTFDINK